MENYMGFKIEQLAQRAVESIQDETDRTTLANHSDVFTFMQSRIFEEIEQIVLSKIDGWFTSEWDEPNYPNDGFDDGQALASAGWGTDEDYGSASDML